MIFTYCIGTKWKSGKKNKSVKKKKKCILRGGYIQQMLET